MKKEVWAMLYALVFPSVMTWVYFVAAAGPGADASPAMMVAYVVGKVLQFGFPLLYVALTEPQSLRPRWPGWSGLLFGFAFGLVVGGAALALYHGLLHDTKYLHETPDKVVAKLHSSGLDTVNSFVGLAFFYSIFHSFLEEYYWRWFVFGWLKRHLRVSLATMISSLGFMAHHVIVLAIYFPGLQQFFTLVVPLSLCIAIGGAVWCWIFHRTDSLAATWISHMLIDAAIMLIGYDMVVNKLSLG